MVPECCTIRQSMGILILSPDQEAARLLCSALERRGAEHAWAQAETESGAAPLVAVVDAGLPGHDEYVKRLERLSPWSRCYIIGEADQAPPRKDRIRQGHARFIYKPFDAAGLAQLLVRDAEVAALERRRQHVEVKADELALLVQSTFEAIIGLDEQLNIVSWNRGATRTYGYEASEIIGHPINVLYRGLARRTPPEHPERRAMHTIRRHKDGHELSVLVSRSEITDELSGSSLKFAEVSLDVTQQQRLEHDLQQSQRLATLGRISATMSHEINNPLAVIRSCAAWLKDFADKSDNEDLCETAEDLEQASERIAGFVDQMCGLARRAPTELARAPLSKTLESALKMVRPRANNKGVQLTILDAHHSTLEVEHDRARLSQAIINVVANAVDAAAEGERQVWVRIVPLEHGVKIEVEDNGPGVAPEMQERLFEPFSTTKPFGHGTGLGLALSREVLQEHKGQIRLNPRPQGGTIAELELPYSSESMNDASRLRSSTPPDPRADQERFG